MLDSNRMKASMQRTVMLQEPPEVQKETTLKNKTVFGKCRA